MSKNLPIFRTLMVGLALGLSLTAVFYSTSAQQSITGTWKASVEERSKKINVNFERRSEHNGKNHHGQTFAYSDLQGLTEDQAKAGGTVRFSLVREAGRIDCEGSFQNGKGSGTFIFTANPTFVSNMKNRGFDFEKRSSHPFDLEERLFAATVLNVTTALADDLTASGFPNLDVEDLFKAAIFKIDSKFMREMKASGFDLGMEELVKARIFKIDPTFVTKVHEMGFANESFDGLVKMQIFKVTPEFIAELRSEGLANLSVEEVVKLRIFKIDGDFIRQAKADGLPLEVEQLVRRKIGVGRN